MHRDYIHIHTHTHIYIYIYDNFVPHFSDADQIGYTGELINADQ